MGFLEEDNAAHYGSGTLDMACYPCRRVAWWRGVIITEAGADRGAGRDGLIVAVQSVI
jgi:hypothetical protein